MLNIAVISEVPRITKSSKELLVAIKSLGHNPSYLRPSKLSLNLNGEIKVSKGEKELQLDGMIIRNLGFALTLEQFLFRVTTLTEIEKKGAISVNPIKSIVLARDKLRSLIALKESGIPIPNTSVSEDLLDAINITKSYKKAVMKPLVGSLGLGSVKVDDEDTAFRIAKSLVLINQPIYLQKYIEKPHRDIRVFVIEDQIFGAMYRISNSWKTNIFQGATPQRVKDLKGISEIAIKASEVLGLIYAGVDIVEDLEGNYYVIEVNACPQWKGISTVVGRSPAIDIVKAIVRRIKK